MLIDGSQIRQETVTGDEILDESVTGDDIKNDSIDWVDLKSSIANTIKANFRNSLVNTLEIATINGGINDETLSIFVDSFNDDSNLDPSSLNVHINEKDGYAGLNPGGELFIVDESKNQFEQATLTDLETFDDVGGDGAVRKTLLIQGQTQIVDSLADLETTERVVVFSDNFEDGDISDWYIELIDNDPNTGLETANIIGNYGLRVDGDDRAYSPNFDCSGLTGIKLRLYIATLNMNNSNEEGIIGWYDGTTWHEVHASEDNEQGYVEIEIPDSLLSANNQLVIDNTNNSTLFGGVNGGGDDTRIDDIEVFYGGESLGSGDGGYLVDFKEGLTGFQVNFTSVDISLFKFIRFYIRKPEDGIYDYRVTYIDGSGTEEVLTLKTFPDTTNWFTDETLISSMTTIDKTDLVSLKVDFIENLEEATVLDVDDNNTGVVTYVSNREGKQLFSVSETVEVGRLTFWVRSRNNVPRMPMYVGLANMFDTTYAIATITPDLVTSTGSYGTPEELTVDLDTPVVLYSGQIYSLLFKTYEDDWNYAWDIARTANNYYEDHLFYFYGNPQSYSMRFKILTPRVSEKIYFENLEIEAESTYESSGEMISRAINLGLTPDSLEGLMWSEVSNGDTISLRLRFAPTESGLATAQWSTVFNDPSGVNNDLSGTPFDQWVQYQAIWSTGDSSSSSILKDVTLNYAVTPGQGQAIVVSAEETTENVPTSFMINWLEALNSGTIQYFISRDGRVTWQAIQSSQEGILVDFTVGVGTKIHIKAVITGDAQLYGWSFGTTEEFL